MSIWQATHDRMVAELELSNLAPSTVRRYLRAVERMVVHTGRDPLELGETELREYLLHLKKENGRRAIVVFTDGRDENNPGTAPGSAHNFKEVLTLAREVGATIFSVGLGPRIDAEVLQTLATQSGGQAYFSQTVEELTAQFTHIIENLRQRYVVSYSSTNFDRNGKWRAVQIRPRDPGLVVSSTEGYFAPDK